MGVMLVVAISMSDRVDVIGGYFGESVVLTMHASEGLYSIYITWAWIDCFITVLFRSYFHANSVGLGITVDYASVAWVSRASPIDGIGTFAGNLADAVGMLPDSWGGACSGDASDVVYF